MSWKHVFLCPPSTSCFVTETFPILSGHMVQFPILFPSIPSEIPILGPQLLVQGEHRTQGSAIKMESGILLYRREMTAERTFCQYGAASGHLDGGWKKQAWMKPIQRKAELREIECPEVVFWVSGSGLKSDGSDSGMSVMWTTKFSFFFWP